MNATLLQISIRELKARPAYAIERARAGVSVLITSHRKTVAQIVATSSSADTVSRATPKRRPSLDSGHSTSVMTTQEALVRLRLAGVQVKEAIHPISVGTPATFAPLPDGKTMSELVLDMRGPR